MAMTLAENRADLFRTGCFGALSTVSGPWKPRTGKRGGQGDRHFQIAARGAKIISASGRPCGLGIRAACRDTLRLVIPWFEIGDGPGQGGQTHGRGANDVYAEPTSSQAEEIR